MAGEDAVFVGSSSSLISASGSGPRAERRPVEELYGVFRRPRNDADRRAGELASRRGALDFPERRRRARMSDDEWRRARLGAVEEAEGRLLLQGLGGEADMLYAAPTDNSCVAYALLPNGGGGCTAPGPDGLVLGWNQQETGALTVFGLVGDAIAAVDLVVDGTTHGTPLGENAFGFRFERMHESNLERLVLHRRDGTTNALDLQPK
jgi:hypothetical protein